MKLKIVLPDGSEVFINNATRVAYNKAKFNDKLREVWLEEGKLSFCD